MGLFFEVQGTFMEVFFRNTGLLWGFFFKYKTRSRGSFLASHQRNSIEGYRRCIRRNRALLSLLYGSFAAALRTTRGPPRQKVNPKP